MRNRRIRRLGITVGSLALATGLLVGCQNDTTSSSSQGDTSSTSKSSAPAPRNNPTSGKLPAWKAPSGVKIDKVFSGNNTSDDDESSITMKGAPTGFTWRYTCTGQATDSKLNGQYMGIYVNGVGQNSVSLIDNAAWHKTGAGYSPTGTLFSVQPGEDVHFVVRGKCTFELGQINTANPPTDPILQTP